MHHQFPSEALAGIQRTQWANDVARKPRGCRGHLHREEHRGEEGWECATKRRVVPLLLALFQQLTQFRYRPERGFLPSHLQQRQRCQLYAKRPPLSRGHLLAGVAHRARA